MKVKRHRLRRLKAKKSSSICYVMKKSSSVCYVIRYVAEGVERECFYQDTVPEDEERPMDHFSPDLNEATLFRSRESAERTARALDSRDPAGPGAHEVVTVQTSLVLEVLPQRI
jgi:hypothetical protein